MSNFNMPEFVNQGWQCPFCKRVYAPMVTSCFCQCNQKSTTYVNTGTPLPQHEGSTCHSCNKPDDK
jgi:hypothetical protein